MIALLCIIADQLNTTFSCTYIYTSSIDLTVLVGLFPGEWTVSCKGIRFSRGAINCFGCPINYSEIDHDN